VRVAFCIDSLGAGGAQQQLLRLAAVLPDHGVAPQVHWYNEAKRFHDLPDSVGGGQLPRSGKVDPRFWRALRQMVAGADLVHAWLPAPGFYAALASLGLPTPIVHAVRCSPEPFQVEPAQGRLTLAAVALSHAVTVNARSMAQWLGAHRVPAERIRCVPNLLAPALVGRVASSPAERAALLTSLGLDPQRPPVVALGRFDAYKNQDGLVRAWARVRDRVPDLPPLLLAGDAQAPERVRAVERLARELRLDVRVVPPVQDVWTLLEAVRVSVLASRSEGMPNVVLEGLAVGAVTVSTRVGEVPHLVRDGETGLTCAAEDDSALADALERALRLAPEAARAMGQRAREDVRERFAASAVASQYAELYREVAARKGRRIGVARPFA
jgi:glycosyltransferase involved in cell wall biosynthesis